MRAQRKAELAGEGDHCGIAVEHVTLDARDAVTLGVLQQALEEQAADAMALPAIRDRDSKVDRA